MTDIELLEKKLALIETSIRELRELIEPREILVDIKAERFAEHTLQIAIQAAQDVASHIVSDGRLGEPRTNRELFEILARNGWIPDEAVAGWNQIIGFRNILVHGYQLVDPKIVKDVVENRLDELRAFVAQIQARLSNER